jgi:hypothetical protein
VLHQERGVEADEREPEVHLAQRLVHHPAGHLREPEVDARVGGEHDRAEQHVVEVRHHEVRVGDVEVDRRRGEQDAVRPPNRKVTRKPSANSIGVSNVIWPFQSVPIQLTNLMPGRDRDEERGEREERQQHRAGGVHVVRPHRHRQRRDRDARVDHALVAEQRLAGEHRDDLGDDAEERQRDDVDLGVAEEPEQVLPQDDAAVGRVEHVRAEVAVHQQPEQRRGEDRERDEHQQRGDEDHPGEDRHPEHRHAGARMQTIVVMKLTPPRMVPRPARARPMIHRSPPKPGEWMASESGV